MHSRLTGCYSGQLHAVGYPAQRRRHGDLAHGDAASAGMSLSYMVVRASAGGLIFARSTSSSPVMQLSTPVSSLITAGQVPMECRMRAPGAGRLELTARIRLFPTTHPE